jgi:metal-responsive CopG/Arc/MetJ family transcriptional regulator
VRTVQLTLDEALVEDVDRLVKEVGTSRSEFTRRALRSALDRHQTEAREHLHREGYERLPVEPNEVADWEEEVVWPD